MTRYRKCSEKDLQNRLQFINRHLETLNSIKRELLEESELRMELRMLRPQSGLELRVEPPAPPALIRQIASLPDPKGTKPEGSTTRPPSPETPKETHPPVVHIKESNPKGSETLAEPIEEPNQKGSETIAEPDPKGPEAVLQFLEEPDNVSLASNEINNIEQELKESLEKLSLAKMKKTLSRSKPTKVGI